RGPLRALSDAHRDRPGYLVRRAARDLPLLQHGSVRRPGARDVPQDRRRGVGRRLTMVDASAPPVGPMRPEIWAGVECSVVRVGDRIVDELALTGHARRPGDLRRLADLGVTAVRYPA